MGDPGEGDAKAVPVEPPAEPGHEAPAGASPAGPPWDESRWNGSPWARDAPPDIVEPRRDGDRSSAEPAPIGGTRPTVPRPGPRAAPVATAAGGGNGADGGKGPGDGSGAGRSKRRRGRVLLIVGLVVLLALVTMDRVAAYVAPGQIAAQIKKDQQLPNQVDASVGGVPFLTQVVFGKYDDLGFTLHRLQLPGICVDRVNAHLKGLHLPVTKILGKPGKIPVDRVTIAVLLDYADVNQALANQPLHVQFAPDGNAAKVTARVLGQEGGATVELGARGQQLTITVKSIDVFGISVPLPGPTVPVPLSLKGLPFDARLTGARTTAAGLELEGAADHLTLQAPSSPAQPVKGC